MIKSDFGFYILELFLSLLEIAEKEKIEILGGTKHNLWGAAKTYLICLRPILLGLEEKT